MKHSSTENTLADDGFAPKQNASANRVIFSLLPRIAAREKAPEGQKRAAARSAPVSFLAHASRGAANVRAIFL